MAMRQIPFDLEIYRSQMQVILGDDPRNNVFWEGLNFAVEAHSDQWRKSGDAYILHPCSVAKILAKEMDITHPEILTAALLHDTVEDVEEVTAPLVGEIFGSYVQAIVEGCTKVTHVSGTKQHNATRTHRKIFSGAAERPEVMLVKLADRLHNLRTLQAMPKRKRQRIAEETLDIYAPLATVFGLFDMKREMYNLALLYKFPKQGAKLRSSIHKLERDQELAAIIARMRERAAESNLECNVRVRVKDLWAYYNMTSKILLKQIDTPVEIVMIVENKSECYRALGVMNRTYPPIPRTIRDFIANPKPTGYQGLHARTIIDGRKYLIKIRTAKMANNSRRGVFQDWSSDDTKQMKFVQEIREMFNVLGSDDSFSYRDVIAASGRKEIYLYTPNGDLVCLPFNSTVLDFAFRVHTAIGRECIGAIIRNKKVESNYLLRDGDVVKIIRSFGVPVRFEQEDLASCKTPRARSEIAKGFRIRHNKVTTLIGESMLKQELRNYGLPLELLEHNDVNLFLKPFSLENLNDLYARIGEGRLHLHPIIATIKEQLFDGISLFVEPTGKFNSLKLKTLDPISVKLSSCCHPNPTAKDNFALLTRYGISVHHKKCKTLQKIDFRRDDAVNITWDHSLTNVRKVQIITVRGSRMNVMELIGTAPACMKLHDVKLLSVRHKMPEPSWEVLFKVENLKELLAVQRHFRRSYLATQHRVRN